MTEKEWQTRFISRLRKKMYQRGFNQKELAEAAGLNQGSVSRYMTGERIPSVYILRRIADALECEPNDLV